MTAGQVWGLVVAGLLFVLAACGSAAASSSQRQPASSPQSAGSSPASSTAAAAGEWTVSSVTDGDTVKVDQLQGTVLRRLTIRVRGIDTPETKKPGTPVQCWGPDATAFARSTLQGRPVRLVLDAGDQLDRYDRTVAEVWLTDGSSYAERVAWAGLGRAYTFNPKHPASNRAAIEAAQRAAMAAHRGLWGQQVPVGEKCTPS